MSRTLFRSQSHPTLFLFVAFSILVFIGHHSFALAQTSPATCHIWDSTSTIPAGFGVPYDVFSATKATIMKALCGGGEIKVTIGNGSSNQYIYTKGYYAQGNTWVPYTLSCLDPISSNWCPGTATGTLTGITTQASNENIFLAYVCTQVGSAWKCGCRDAACATSNWQIQKTVSTPIPTPPTVSLSADKTVISSGGTVTLVWQSTNAVSCTRSWAAGATGPVSGTFTTPALLVSTTFSVTCSNATGASSSASVAITITSANSLPTATIVNPASNLTKSLGDNIYFQGTATDTDGTIVSYAWRTGSCSSGTLLSSASAFDKADLAVGTHTVYFSAKDNLGAWSTNCPSRVITVTPSMVNVLHLTQGKWVSFTRPDQLWNDVFYGPNKNTPVGTKGNEWALTTELKTGGDAIETFPIHRGPQPPDWTTDTLTRGTTQVIKRVTDPVNSSRMAFRFELNKTNPGPSLDGKYRAEFTQRGDTARPDWGDHRFSSTAVLVTNEDGQAWNSLSDPKDAVIVYQYHQIEKDTFSNPPFSVSIQKDSANGLHLHVNIYCTTINSPTATEKKTCASGNIPFVPGQWTYIMVEYITGYLDEGVNGGGRPFFKVWYANGELASPILVLNYSGRWNYPAPDTLAHFEKFGQYYYASGAKWTGTGSMGQFRRVYSKGIASFRYQDIPDMTPQRMLDAMRSL